VRRFHGGGDRGDADLDVQLVPIAEVVEGNESLAFYRAIEV
jgi:hypothetical protein